MKEKIYEVCMSYGKTVFVKAKSEKDAINIATEEIDTGDLTEEIDISVNGKYNLSSTAADYIINN